MIKLNTKYLENFISESDYLLFESKLENAHKKLHNNVENSFGKGWLYLPSNYKSEDLKFIYEASEEIREKCDVLIVIGIGGSYLGSKAALEFLSPKYYGSHMKTKVMFAGNSLSAYEISKIIDVCKSKDVCLNVISKSGGTLECALTFRILREILESKYGKSEASKRIFCTTGFSKLSTLKNLASENKYRLLEIPQDVGGRYSVLTSVGLLPLCVAGVDIKEMISGALSAQKEYESLSFENECYKYALIRNILYSKGKSIEIIAGYEPSLKYFFEWWKQLFGESEGKNKKGIFPSSVVFSSDLHSLGQFIQEGNPIIFETVLTFNNHFHDISITKNKNDLDNLNYLSGKTVEYVNSKAFEGTILAHMQGGVPNIHLEIDSMDEYNLGYLIYFFEKACAISAYISGVNPFDQPGVEAYKKNMFSLLKNP